MHASLWAPEAHTGHGLKRVPTVSLPASVHPSGAGHENTSSLDDGLPWPCPSLRLQGLGQQRIGLQPVLVLVQIAGEDQLVGPRLLQ